MLGGFPRESYYTMLGATGAILRSFVQKSHNPLLHNVDVKNTEGVARLLLGARKGGAYNAGLC
jgi:hypothetical protein